MARSVDAFLKKCSTTYGANVIQVASKAAGLTNVDRVKTGILAVDNAYGSGLAVGRMHLLAGEFSSGKSALAYRIAGAFQRYCRNCGKPMFSWNELLMEATPIRCCKEPEKCRVLWADVEGVWDNKWASRLGLDTDASLVGRIEFAEQAIDITDAAIRSGDIDLVVIDSQAALTPSKEIEASAEEWQMGLAARLMNKAARRWTSAQNSMTPRLGKTCTLVIINQIRMKIGVVYGDPRTLPGGKGIPYHSSTIAMCKAKGLKQIGELVTGINMELAVTKNKTAPPMRTAKFDLSFADLDDRKPGGSNLAEQVIALASFWGLIKKSGSWYELAKGVRLQGAEASGRYLRSPEGLKLMNFLVKQIDARENGWLSGDDSAIRLAEKSGVKRKDPDADEEGD